MGKKVNVYTLTIDKKSNLPKRYEMLGYDSLFGSHYDKYEVLYTFFDDAAPSDDVFETPEGAFVMFCYVGRPGGGVDIHLYSYIQSARL